MTGPAAWLRRHRAVLAVGAGVLAILVVLTAVAARSAGRTADLDPGNAEPNGARAVARVLADRGVAVSVVRRAAAWERATVDRGTTVLVTSPENLGRSTAGRVAARAAGAGALVLAAPGRTLVRALDLPVEADTVPAGDRAEAGCDDPLLAGLSLDVGPSSGYRGTGAAGRGVTGCFPGPGDRPAALVVRVDRAVPTYAVGGVDLLTNDRVDRGDNAAAALRLLGQRDRLVWYVPDPRDVPAGDAGSPADQLPGGLLPALWLVAAAVLATMLWRGRRLGALVTEPLPVVVKAIESTRGRGRLYRRVRDRSHAAAILRAAAARRIGSHLRLPAGTDLDGLTRAVATATGRDPADVLDVLARRPVGDDAALTRLAGDLAALEREVHSP